MNLRELLQQLPSELVTLPSAHPALETEIANLRTNSRACQPGDLFLGMPGTRVDGGTFWPEALAAGAVAAITSVGAAQERPAPDANGPLVAVDMVRACAAIAAAFHGYPTRSLAVVGVTGTNGKTTTTHLIEHFLQHSDRAVALLGTLYARWPGFSEVAAHTTPFAVELQGQLAAARAAGSDCAVMEVSSHALEQGRVLECAFDAAVFTNLTQDHLDYHATMDAYFAAKAKLFEPEYLTGRGIVNMDDPYGQRLAAQLGRDRCWRFSLEDAAADLYASDLNYSATGVKGQLNALGDRVAFDLPLVGQFNLANLLAATGAALQLGASLEAIAASLPGFSGVPGRMERVQIDPSQDISVIVDYAHTPDSLENMLRAARPFISGRAICVFGCGGDRDRTKRPQMGKIAAELADVAVLTSDNPRTEDPQQILQDVLEGIPSDAQPIVLADRAAAIQEAISLAQPGDGVLIAGKGHEDYQILGTEKVHFDDREQARAALLAKYPSAG